MKKRGDVPAERTRAVEKIIFPLDFQDPEEAKRFVALLRHHVGLFKIGLELFVNAGPNILEAVTELAGPRIFLDLKFHDIPQTTRGAAAAASRHGVRFMSVHAAGGAQLLEAAVRGAGGRAKVLAVTVLTSLSPEGMRSLGMREDLVDPTRLVLHRAELARRAGCAGVVCSGHEARAVKESCGQDFLVVVPGVRITGDDVGRGDQERVTTPREAVQNGADYIIVGRPIRFAPDPVALAARIAEEIS